MNANESDHSASLASTDLVGKASTHKSTRHESPTDAHFNKVNKMETSRVDMKPESDVETSDLRPKRSKPRQLSGVEAANITEDVFKHTRRFLPRDDSIALLKTRTINAIPMVVPLVMADSDKKQSATEQPLSRIPRRRKPRRLSGDAVENKTRPVLVRDDSVVLTKKKMAGLVPLTLEMDEGPGVVGAEAEKTRKTPARTQSLKLNRLTRQQKQKGYVRQNSCGARTA